MGQRLQIFIHTAANPVIKLENKLKSLIEYNRNTNSAEISELKKQIVTFENINITLNNFLVDETNAQGDNFVGTRSLNTFGPAANAGVRFGVGRKHKNIEVRLSYMKGLNETKPNVFGIAGLFNF